MHIDIYLPYRIYTVEPQTPCRFIYGREPRAGIIVNLCQWQFFFKKNVEFSAFEVFFRFWLTKFLGKTSKKIPKRLFLLYYLIWFISAYYNNLEHSKQIWLDFIVLTPSVTLLSTYSFTLLFSFFMVTCETRNKYKYTSKTNFEFSFYQLLTNNKKKLF